MMRQESEQFRGSVHKSLVKYEQELVELLKIEDADARPTAEMEMGPLDSSEELFENFKLVASKLTS